MESARFSAQRGLRGEGMPEAPWYNSVKYQIPVFVDEVKNALVEKERLLNMKEQYMKRYLNGVRYFAQEHSKEEFDAGVDTFRRLISDVHKLDEEVAELDKKIITILEAKLCRIAFRVKTPKGKLNQLGEEQPVSDLYMVPWNTLQAEERIEITPEQVFLFRLVAKEFGINGLEFIDIPRSQDLFEEGQPYEEDSAGSETTR